MISPETIRAALRDRIIARVAEATGLSRRTVWNVANGVGEPRITTLRILAEYLRIAE